VLEQDVYRVADISGTTTCHPCGTPARWIGSSQQLTVFLAETATEADATRLAGAALPSDWFEALGVAAGRVCCVTVARSWVDGVAPYEGPGALERFREPFTRALEPVSAA
jgi:hypothetical protein